MEKTDMTAGDAELFTMPIIGSDGRERLTWRLTPADRQCALNVHDQSLEVLKSRGGMDWNELAAMVTCDANRCIWSGTMTADQARALVHKTLVARAEPKA